MHRLRKHAKEGRHPETHEKLMVFCFTCTTCQVYGQYVSRARRDREAIAHERLPVLPPG